MAKWFFYTAMGVLALAAAYHLGAVRAAADIDPGNPGPRAIATYVGSVITWDATGACWLASPPSWTRGPSWLDLPVPMDQVAMVDGEHTDRLLLVATDGRAWMSEGAPWQEMDPYPGGTVSTPSQSFGSIKNAFRR